MMLFAYSAVLPNGTRIAGTEAAENADEVIARLHGKKALPLRVEPAGRSRSPISLRHFSWRPRGGRASVIVTAELCMLISAGLTIDRALTIVLERAPAGALRAALAGVRDRVRSGGALAEAMAAEPRVFSAIYVALVRAGEMSGHLDQALNQLHLYLSKREIVAHQVRSALIYPAVLVVTGAASFLLLSNLVLPQFVVMFAEAGKQLPWPARVVLAGNHVLAVSWPLLLVAAVLAVAAGRQFLAREEVTVRLHGGLLAVPVVGPLWRTLDAARMARTAGALLQSGVSLPIALDLSFQALTNAAMVRGARAALAQIRGGASASQALLQSAILPRIRYGASGSRRGSRARG